MSDTDQDTNSNIAPVMDDNIQVTPTTDSSDQENDSADIPMPEISDQNEVTETTEETNDSKESQEPKVENKTSDSSDSLDSSETSVSDEEERVDEGEEEVREDTPEKEQAADEAELATESANESIDSSLQSSEENQNDDNESQSNPDEAISEGEQSATDETTSEDDSNDNVLSQNTNPEAAKGRWYVVHTFSGHENRVATTLKQRIESEHLENKIFDILVPTQDKIEIRSGKKETVKEKIFPGYILIKMILDDMSWLAVRTTQGVTAFIGAMNKPTPISEREVAGIVKFMSQGASPTFKDVFMVDDTVKIIDGPFAEFIGKVDSVDKEKGRVRVLVSIFGRETPVELDFLQVQKL